jgi:hypothetical protein
MRSCGLCAGFKFKFPDSETTRRRLRVVPADLQAASESGGRKLCGRIAFARGVGGRASPAELRGVWRTAGGFPAPGPGRPSRLECGCPAHDPRPSGRRDSRLLAPPPHPLSLAYSGHGYPPCSPTVSFSVFDQYLTSIPVWWASVTAARPSCVIRVRVMTAVRVTALTGPGTCWRGGRSSGIRFEMSRYRDTAQATPGDSARRADSDGGGAAAGRRTRALTRMQSCRLCVTVGLRRADSDWDAVMPLPCLLPLLACPSHIGTRNLKARPVGAVSADDSKSARLAERRRWRPES